MTTGRRGCRVHSEAAALTSGKTALMTAYGVVECVAFLALFAYSIGRVEGLVVSRTIDDSSTAALTKPIVVDLTVLSMCAVQPSVMTRCAFKRPWTRIVRAPIERSTPTGAPRRSPITAARCSLASATTRSAGRSLRHPATATREAAARLGIPADAVIPVEQIGPMAGEFPSSSPT
jgi:hypothetical protein